jgi:hypothetical protein
MDFWDDLSTATKGAIIGGAILLVVIIIVRAMEPKDEDIPLPPLPAPVTAQ